MSFKRFRFSALACATLLVCMTVRAQQLIQQGNPLLGSGAVGNAAQGYSVALSGDGNTLLEGGPYDNGDAGAAWVFTRAANGNWSQQGGKLVGTGAVGDATQGWSVALSADGNTALVGGPDDNGDAGAAWVFTRAANGNWSQQGSKLVGTGAVGDAEQGSSVALSGDGNTALIGGPNDNGDAGAVWIFTRDANGNWSQQGSKLVGTGAVGRSNQGWSVALSTDGNTALEGGPYDDHDAGAAWVFTRDSNGNWSQQGGKLAGTGGEDDQGYSVALSGDGNTAILGDPAENDANGAASVFTSDSSGNWTQQTVLVGTIPSNPQSPQEGQYTSLSTDGNTALVSDLDGFVFVFARDTAGNWSEEESVQAVNGQSVLSGNAGTVAVGDNTANSGAGGVLIFVSVPAFNPTSLNFGNENVGTTTAAQTITLSNGNPALSITSIAVTGTNAADFALTSNSCGSAVPAASSCTVAVTFTPSAAGTRTAALTITDSAPNSPQTIALSGTGIAPAVTLSASSLTFADQLISTTSAAQTVKLTNTGNGPLKIQSIAPSGDFAISSNTCGNSVAAGTACSIGVTFHPTAAGTRSGLITISDNAANSPQKVALTGVGFAVTVSAKALTFGDQLLGTASAAKVITFANHGTAAVSISSLSITGDFSKTTSCGTSLAGNTSCTINVSFKPTAIGTRTGTLTINDSDPTSPQQVSLSGTGTAVSVSPTALSFATQLVGTISSPKSVYVTNHGNTALSISGITATGDFAQNRQDNTCGATLAAQTTCTINVFFTPTKTGTRTGSLSISDNGGGSPQNIGLSGVGTVVVVTPTSVNFGSQGVGTTSAAQTVELTNHSSAALSITGITITGADSGDFSQINACGTSLAAESTCAIDVTFKPSATGSRTAALSISDNGGGSPQLVALSGTGT
jgi:uncharacterized protein YdbL (DUF1318 family)